MAVDYDIAKVAADIDMGRHDDDLGPIFDALRRRMGQNLVDFSWRIDLGDVGAFELEDMTGLALEAAEHAMGKTMHSLNPEHSVREWRGLVAAWLLNDKDWTEDAIEDLVRSYNVDRIVESVSWRVAGPAPKGTSGSSSTRKSFARSKRGRRKARSGSGRT